MNQWQLQQQVQQLQNQVVAMGGTAGESKGGGRGNAQGKGTGSGLQCQVSSFNVDAIPFPCTRCTKMDHSAKWCPRKSEFCIGCGKKRHLRVACRDASQVTHNWSHRDSTCQACKKVGHIPAVCRYTDMPPPQKPAPKDAGVANHAGSHTTRICLPCGKWIDESVKKRPGCH